MITTPDQMAALRQQFVQDHQRPRYHYLPPAHWMNDPNGLLQWNGQYHLFYQHNPNAAVHKDMHWGHATSRDLIHWTDLPIALAPTPGTWDEAGCFSGCGINNDGVPTLMYTGVRGETYEIQTQGIVTSRDENLITWDQHPNNPLIREVPAEARQTRDFRDPFVWREHDGWYCLLASRIEGIGGTLFLYRSPDLVQWEYLHPFLTGRMEQTGRTWECPNFFPLGDKYVLILSAHISPGITATVFYFIGDYVDHRFVPEYQGILDSGTLYAPLTMLDDQGRRLLFGWLREGRPVDAQRDSGWSGVQSIPRVLSLTPDKQLAMQPVPEVEQLRGAHHHSADVALNRLNGDVRLSMSGTALDIVAEFEPGSTGLFGLRVLASPDGSEQTSILYDAPTQRLIIYRDQSSLARAADKFAHAAPHPLAPGDTLKLRILLDGSVIEVIGNDRTSITSRVYTTRANSTGVYLTAQNSDGQLRSLDAWEMRSIWPG